MALGAAPGGENPSAAYLAGAQHGAQLAVTHHVAATKTPAAPKPAAPVRKTTAVSTVPTLNSILAQARAAAGQDTTAQVNAIKQQQDLYNTQASDRANQINLASQAAAKFLAGLGDNTANSYNNAAGVLAGLAQGYSGDLKNTATDAASQVQAQLAGLGAPAGSLKTATGQTSQPEALANVLYGLGGAIPGNLLVTSGQAQAAAQRQLPASTLGYGQQQALGTIAAGQQQADQLTPQILDALAGQPKLAQQYLASLQSAQSSAASQALSQKLANSLIDSRTTSGKVAQQNANTAVTRANNAATAASQRLALQQKNYNLAVQKFNAGQAAGSTTASRPSSSITKSINDGFLHLADGTRALVNGQPVKVAKTTSSSTGDKPLGLSRKDYLKQQATALGAARNYHQAWSDPGVDGGKPQPPLTWSQYLTHGEAAGIAIPLLYLEGRKIYTAQERATDSRPGG
jgi:hypothetical protein